MQMKRLLNNITKVRGIKTGVRITLTFSAIAYFAGCTGIADKSCQSGRASDKRQNEILLYSEFRSAVQWQAPKTITQNGKIVLYKNFLLVNDPSKGIHVFDNSESDSPKALGFLSIPGNSDIVIKNDIIYAESYNDIVLIGVSATGELAENDRIKDAFTFRYGHTSEGVIIGYHYERVCIPVKE